MITSRRIVAMGMAALIALAALAPHHVHALNTEIVGQVGGEYQAVTLHEDRLYVAHGAALEIFSLDNPREPMLLGKAVVPDIAWDIAVADGVAYLANWSAGLVIVDVSQPATPLVLGAYDYPVNRHTHSNVYQVEIVGTHAFLGTGGGMLVVDVSDPAAPEPVFETLDFGTNLLAAAPYVYTIDGSGNLLTLNVANPANPTTLSSLSLEGRYYESSMHLSGDTLFVGGGAGLAAVNVANPAGPSFVASYPGMGLLHPGNVRAMTVRQGNLFVADADQGLLIFDPSNLQWLAHPYFDEGFSWMAGGVDELYLANADLAIFDITQPLEAAEVARWEDLVDVSVVAVEDNVAIAGSFNARGYRGFEVFDIAARLHPEPVARIDYSDDAAWDVELEEGIVYAVNSIADSLDLYDLRSPAQPTLLSTFSDATDPLAVALDGTSAFVADGSEGVISIDVTDPANPRGLDRDASIDTNGCAVATAGGQTYVAVGGAIAAYDTSVPDALAFRGGYSVFSCQLAASGPLLATRTTTADPRTQAVGLLDMTDPAQPELINGISLPQNSQVRELVIHDGFLYVLVSASGSGSGVRVYDLTDPRALLNLFAEVRVPGFPWDVAVEGNHVFVANSGRGMTVAKITVPVVRRIDPPLGPEGFAQTVIVHGSAFEEGTSVSVGGVPATTTFHTPDRIEIQVPPTLAPGVHDVQARNSETSVHTRRGAYEVLDATADGLWAPPENLFTDPAPPRAQETSGLGIEIHRFGGLADLENVVVDFFDGPPEAGDLIGSAVIDAMAPNSSAITPLVDWAPAHAFGVDVYARLNNSDVVVMRTIEVAPSASDQTAPIIHSATIAGQTRNAPLPGRNTWITISASDDNSGVGWAYAIEFAWNARAGFWYALQESDWVPWELALRGVPMTLSGPPGSRYIDVWVADYGGNISNAASIHANYKPPQATVGGGEHHMYSYWLDAGQNVTALLGQNGDADLYAGNEGGWSYSSTQSGPVDEMISFTAPSSDLYSFMVLGTTTSTYGLTIGGIPGISRAKGERSPGAALAPGSSPSGLRALPPIPAYVVEVPPEAPLFVNGFEG